MRVVRVEDAYHPTRGAFRGAVRDVVYQHHHSKRGWGHLPGPYDEFRHYIDGDEVCCAVNADQLQQWWPQRVLMALSKQTYRHLKVRVLEARVPMLGRYQGIINRRKSKVVREFSIWEWARMSLAEREAALQ